jgi:hypothetical protein
MWVTKEKEKPIIKKLEEVIVLDSEYMGFEEMT